MPGFLKSRVSEYRFEKKRPSGAFFLLKLEKGLAILPKLFKIIETTLVGREEMDDDISKIHDHPAVTGKALHLALLFEFCPRVFDNRFCERVKHSIAGAGADDKVISK